MTFVEIKDIGLLNTFIFTNDYKFFKYGGSIMKKVTKDLEKLGIVNVIQIYRNLTPAELVEHALKRGEGTLSSSGALVVTTGKYTGRSPKDKYIVDTPGVHEKIAWGNVNKPIEKEKFDSIYNKLYLTVWQEQIQPAERNLE